MEAQACGTPVIAFGKGGVLETIRPYGVPNPSGIFFNEQKIGSLIMSIEQFENANESIDPIACRNNALRFSNERFQIEMQEYVENKWLNFKKMKCIEY